ncbi:MAG: hypothetical protein KBG48_03775 [Kofleriaceae bacterium]|nr:hypothetical protein [Kofleriaceae bacterium]MBP9166475.1 hypothetical protein [Kofleriaceae bacterium]MBP9860294.1 hypothetical protein [Kofleriaceae bacterium]
MTAARALTVALIAIAAACDDREIDLSPDHPGNECECRIRCPNGDECGRIGSTCGADGLCVDPPDGVTCLGPGDQSCAAVAPTAACVAVVAGAVCDGTAFDAGLDTSAVGER